jgi:YhcH/YjgK/YiaL family protein
MILGRLGNPERIVPLHSRFREALEFLGNAAEHSDGKITLDGESLYATISRQPGKTREEAFLESHRRYIDIHLCLEGEEEIGWRSIHQCGTVDTPYDGSNDFMAYVDRPSTWVRLTPGTFAVFFPEDAHAPLVSGGTIRKAVVKVLEK